MFWQIVEMVFSFMEFGQLKTLLEKLYSLGKVKVGKILESELVNTMIKMMENTIETGTGKNAKINRPAAGKTGTSQSLRDAWFIGFSSELVVGVWFGNDDDSPMNNITECTAASSNTLE